MLVDVRRTRRPSVVRRWQVFTSARWHGRHLARHPDSFSSAEMPDSERSWRATVSRATCAVHSTVEAALAALTDTRCAISRASTGLPAALSSLRNSTRTGGASGWPTGPSSELVPVATVVVNVFVENVLEHTPDAGVLVFETDGATVAVSVQDASSAPAARHEDSRRGGERISGLAIVASVCRAWGNTPRPSGKTVWAVIGPENQL